MTASTSCRFLCGNTGVQMAGWFKKPIEKVDDFKGLKMRIPGLAGRVIVARRVTSGLPGGEIFPALERGVIDAAELVGPYDDEKLGFCKIAKHYYTRAGRSRYPMYQVMINMQKWNSLPKPYQEAIVSAAREANIDMVAENNARTAGTLMRLKNNGVIAQLLRRHHEGSTRPPPPTLRENAAKTAKVKTIYEAWKNSAPRGSMVRAERVVHGSVLRGQPSCHRIASFRYVHASIPSFADAVDRLDEQVGQTLKWLALFASLIARATRCCATPSTPARPGSKIQWHMFGAMCLLAAGYALKHGEHVRVDVFFSKISPRTQDWVDLVDRPVPDADLPS